MRQGKVDGTVKISKVWIIPADAEKPWDGRQKVKEAGHNLKCAEGKRLRR